LLLLSLLLLVLELLLLLLLPLVQWSMRCEGSSELSDNSDGNSRGYLSGSSDFEGSGRRIRQGEQKSEAQQRRRGTGGKQRKMKGEGRKQGKANSGQAGGEDGSAGAPFIERVAGRVLQCLNRG
jgi:hypothetical protein